MVLFTTQDKYKTKTYENMRKTQYGIKFNLELKTIIVVDISPHSLNQTSTRQKIKSGENIIVHTKFKCTTLCIPLEYLIKATFQLFTHKKK